MELKHLGLVNVALALRFKQPGWPDSLHRCGFSGRPASGRQAVGHRGYASRGRCPILPGRVPAELVSAYAEQGVGNHGGCHVEVDLGPDRRCKPTDADITKAATTDEGQHPIGRSERLLH